VTRGKRPDTQLRGHSGESVQIIKSCWEQQPERRPDASTLKDHAEELLRGTSEAHAQGAAHGPPVQRQAPTLGSEPPRLPDAGELKTEAGGLLGNRSGTSEALAQGGTPDTSVQRKLSAIVEEPHSESESR